MPFTSETFTPDTATDTSISTFTDVTEESGTASYSIQLQDSTNANLPNTALTSATLSYVDQDTGAAINDRETQDILGGGTGANDVTISATGLVTWQITTDDSIIVDPTDSKHIEYHRATFTFVYTDPVSTDTIQLVHQMRHPIRRSFGAAVLTGPTL